MYRRRLTECPQFLAGDMSHLREILNPHKETIDIHYSLAWAQVLPHEETLPHTLACSEVYYILKGSGKMHVNNETKKVGAHDALYIPAHAIQWIENTGSENLEFLCIVDPPWKPEAERIVRDTS